jgi:hypothetical protein
MLRISTTVVLMGLCQAGLAQQSASDPQARRAAIQAEMKTAIQAVQRIVNQPVTQLARNATMQVSEYPYWFHEGAAKPDFNTADVRVSRDISYGKHQYVTSDLNPGVVFLGADVEFNPMTKYFYADYSVPKKKLSDGEMLEINRLYRVIGKCQKQLAN